MPSDRRDGHRPTKKAARKPAKKTSTKRSAKKRTSTPKTTKKTVARAAATPYQAKKEHKGKSYSGMRVGRVHRWTYPDGVWHEKKLEPSRWELGFASHKVRKGRAPEGSGAEPGSGYHWLIIADQWVKKLDANTYATLMEGEKHLIAFQKPDWERWNTQFGNQRSARQKTIKVLKEVLARLEAEEAAESIETPEDHPVFLNVKVKEGAPQIVQELAAGRSDPGR